MGWLFGKKKNKFEIDSQTRGYIERHLEWLFRNAYDPDTFKFKLHLPTENEFPEFSKDPKANLIQLVDYLCTKIGLQEIVTISVFNAKTFEWETWRQGQRADEEPPFVLQVREETLQYRAHLIAGIVLDLGAIMLAHLYLADEEPGEEQELHATFHGFSVVLLCAYTKVNVGFISGPWQDPSHHLYATSLLCRLFNVDHSSIKPYLDDDAYEFLDGMIKEHQNSDHFLEFKRECLRLMRLAPDFKIAFASTCYTPEVIDAYTRLIAEEKNTVYYNNRGYSYLLNGRFQEALSDLNKCIELDPYYAYAFNNRAYCRMFLGDMNGAWNDLDVSFTFDPKNSFNFRNKGIYFLLSQKPEQALEQMQLAYQSDRKTEHIHYWLGKAHFALNNLDEAKKHFERSRSIPELPAPEYPM